MTIEIRCHACGAPNVCIPEAQAEDWTCFACGCELKTTGTGTRELPYDDPDHELEVEWNDP